MLASALSHELFSWRDYVPFFWVSLSSCLAQKGHPGRNVLWMKGLKWAFRERSNQSVVWVILFWNRGTHSLKGVQAVWNIRWEHEDESVLTFQLYLVSLPQWWELVLLCFRLPFTPKTIPHTFSPGFTVMLPVSFPWWAIEARPLQWKNWILTTRPPGNFLHCVLFKITCIMNFASPHVVFCT